MTRKQKPSKPQKASDVEIPTNYASTFAEIKERIQKAQYEALRRVNKQLVGLYWDVGRIILERQANEGWGKSVVERLSTDLQREFPGVSGFSASNLWRMKAFHEAYSNSEKLAPLVREIGWSHNLIILERCSDPFEREFYLRMTRKFGWSKNVLRHQIENQSYEKKACWVKPISTRPFPPNCVLRPNLR